MGKRLPVVTVTRARRSRDPLLIELIAAIGAGNLELGPIHDETYYVDGICDDDGRVRINLSHHAVDVCLHECIHRLRPKWKEQTVRQRVGKLLRQMSDQEIDTLYNVIQATAIVKTKPDTLR